MKQKINKYISALLFAVALMFPSSCSNDFLDVKNPSKLDPAFFPAELKDFELMMNSLYGQLRDGFYGQYFRSMPLIDHGNDNGYDGAEFNEFCLNNLNPNLVALREIWTRLYSHITKCNDFIIQLKEYKESAPAQEAVRIGQMEGEAKFFRALAYFFLVNKFGEKPIWTEADKNTLGVPLWVDELASNIVGTSRARATQGQVYDQIISDLETALPVFIGKGKLNNEDARVDEWAVKSLLAKTYMFTLQWSKAVPVLEDIINNSGKELVSYNILRDMFNGRNEFNKESIFEISFIYDPQSNSQVTGTGTVYQRFVSITYINKKGAEVINGYSNFYVHDENIPRYGFDDSAFDLSTPALYPLSIPKDFNSGVLNPAYKAYSLQVRQDKSVDPRLFVAGYQPYIDTVNLNNGDGWLLITKGRMEGYPNRDMRAWNNRKYCVDDKPYVGNCGINSYVFRLADIYLLYAESLIKSGGDQAVALEYINKVHRRAYDQPVNSPSPYDYTSLSDRTKTLDPTDHLANDVLKYERWAELINEGSWWFDVRRWDIGQKEANYYKKSNSGVLVWSGKYGWPIPQVELNSNSLMVQNP
jgi:hypothetical protein